MYLVSIVSSNDWDWTYSEPKLFEKREDAVSYFKRQVSEYVDQNEWSTEKKWLIQDATDMIVEKDLVDLFYAKRSEMFDWNVNFTHEWNAIYFWNEEENWAVTFELHPLEQNGN